MTTFSFQWLSANFTSWWRLFHRTLPLYTKELLWDSTWPSNEFLSRVLRSCASLGITIESVKYGGVSPFKLPVDIVLELFDQLVIPVMLYGSEGWCFSDITHIEVLYRKFLKELLGVNRCTTNAMVYGETGTMPVSKLILSRATNYFMNICNGKRTKLSYIMYKLLRCKQENHPLYQSHWLN